MTICYTCHDGLYTVHSHLFSVYGRLSRYTFYIHHLSCISETAVTVANKNTQRLQDTEYSMRPRGQHMVMNMLYNKRSVLTTLQLPLLELIKPYFSLQFSWYSIASYVTLIVVYRIRLWAFCTSPTRELISAFSLY